MEPPHRQRRPAHGDAKADAQLALVDDPDPLAAGLEIMASPPGKRLQALSLLSGGEQQMLAIGRGLMAAPRLLLLDEPSMGLAPIMVEKIFEVIRDVSAQGITILLVEQNAERALEIADHGYVLQTGQIVLAGSGAELASSDLVKQAYLAE